MITSISKNYFFSALSFISIGILLGNMIFVYMGLMPILFLLTGLVFSPPDKPKDIEVETKQNHYIGDIIQIERKIEIEQGLGPVLYGEKLPKHFELVEGNNISLSWKGLAPYSKTLQYKIRCTKRGIYNLSNAQWETKHSLGLIPTEQGELLLNQTLIVQTIPLQVKKIRQQKVFSNIPMPSEAQIRLGIPTTDFKELREYNFGDSYKNINWKATSRRAYLMKPPMVNEFENEGMKIVWLFMNTSSNMALGTSISNPLEYAVQAIMGLTQFYLGRNCRLGLSLYDDEKSYKITGWSILLQSKPAHREEFLIPDTGKRQLYQVTNKMLEAEIGKGLYDLERSVKNCRGHIIGWNPLFYLVTCINESNIDSLEQGIRELRRYSKTSRHKKASIIVIHVASYKIKASNKTENLAADILEIEKIHLFRRLRGKGVMVVQWDPTKHRFTDVLLTQVRRR